MTTKPYNGFPADQRNRAYSWYKKQLTTGQRAKPTTCHACLREHGSVAGHSEDYSYPYGDHIGAIHLCFPCHMAVHTRFKLPRQFNWYKQAIRDGYQLPDTRDYRTFIGQFAAQNGHNMTQPNPPRDTTWLDTLPLTVEEATAQYHPTVNPGNT